MSLEKYIGFTSLGELLWWLNDLAQADLAQCVMWWIVEGEHPYLVKATQELTRATEQREGELRRPIVRLKAPPRSENSSPLDQLWRYAKPYKSKRARSPSYWLFMIESMREETYRTLSTTLKMNGQLVICSTSLIKEGDTEPSPSKERFTAIRSSGVDADLLAQRGLIGVTPLAVFEEGGVTSALPPGWSPPKLPVKCWPKDQPMIWYRELSTRRHSLWAVEVEREGPSLLQLVHWGSPTAESASGIKSDVSSELPHYKVQVKRRPPHRALEISIGARETQSFVFRLKSRADEFSASLVRVMNQLEGMSLPHVLYAAMDWEESYDAPERWHFLYVEHMSGEQLSAWRLLDRFELNSRLSEVGLPHVYVDSASQVSPPLEFLVDTSSNQSLQNLKQMLSTPSEEHITLLEAMPESLTKPLIIQMKRSELRPLSELLVELTEGWNGAELKRATAFNLTPAQLTTWRMETQRHLSDVVTLEHEALEKANREALALLSEEAERAIDGMHKASVPIVDATELAQALAEQIVAADQNYGQVCRALAEVSNQLTQPRRLWVSKETTRATEALNLSAPVPGDLHSARQITDQTTSELKQRSETLTTASQEVTRRRESWVEQQRLSEQIATEAHQQLNLLKEAARQATQRIEAARKVTESNHQEAQRVHQEVKKREKKLLKERKAVEALEAENIRIHEQNERDERELTRRREAGEAERVRVIKRRDVEIPKLRQEITKLEAEVKSLNPPQVDREFNEASAAKESAEQALKVVQKKLSDTQGFIEKKKKDIHTATELQAKLLKENERLKQEVTESQRLSKELESLKRERQQIERVLQELTPLKLKREHSSLTKELSRMKAEVDQTHEIQRLITEQKRALDELQPQWQRLQDMQAQLKEQAQALERKQRVGLSDQELKQRQQLLHLSQDTMERKLTWRDKLILVIGKK